MAPATRSVRPVRCWDANEMSIMLWYAFCVLGGIALDWAFLDRISTSLEVLLKRSPVCHYRDTLLPRGIATICALIAIAHGSAYAALPNAIFYIGVAFFVVSLAVGILQMFPVAGVRK